MAFKLTKEEKIQRNEYVKELQRLEELIEDASKGEDPISQELITEYETAINTASDFASEVESRLQEEFDDKSEKWQEGEKGEEASSFIEEWGGADFTPSDLDAETLKEKGLDFSVAEVLGNLPEMAG